MTWHRPDGFVKHLKVCSTVSEVSDLLGPPYIWYTGLACWHRSSLAWDVNTRSSRPFPTCVRFSCPTSIPTTWQYSDGPATSKQHFLKVSDKSSAILSIKKVRCLKFVSRDIVEDTKNHAQMHMTSCLQSAAKCRVLAMDHQTLLLDTGDQTLTPTLTCTTSLEPNFVFIQCCWLKGKAMYNCLFYFVYF